MSVIFKTLKKLRDKSLEGKEGAEKLKRGRNVYSFRRVFFSPLGILSIALFIFLFGMATLYGVRYLKDYIERKSRESFVFREQKTQVVKIEKGKKVDDLPEEEVIFEEASIIPPPPKAIPVEEARPGRLYLPSTSKKESPVKEIQTVRYLPPRSLRKPEMLGKKITPAGGPPEHPVSSKEPSPSPQAIYLPKRAEISYTYPSKAKKIKASPEQDAIELPPVAPDIAKSDRAKAPAMELPSKALPKLAPKEVSAPARAKQRLKEPIKPKETERTEDERIRLANVEKTAKTASLVTKIKSAMSVGSTDQIEDLIDQLALLKGEENSYVLKLRAFWYLRQHDYKSAAALLNRVLKRDENDLDAGINMAILEIKTDRLTEARKRLARLREIYPENTLIYELIQKLK